MALNYRKLSFNELLTSYPASLSRVHLFELTSIWLDATAQQMLTEQEHVVVHCLFELNDNNQERLRIAWPLVHKSLSKHLTVICSLSSFYSAVTTPFLNENGALTNNIEDDKECKQYALLCTNLFANVKAHNIWQQMNLGPFEDELSQLISSHFNAVKAYAKADNWYISNITDFNSYYQQRPSKLKNTIKRKEKKLAKLHDYHIKIITQAEAFQHHFLQYQGIYQLSWKGEETSFEFIKQVCVQAAAENKLRMGMLFIDGQAVAVQLWFLQQGTASIFKLAYDPQFQQYSVGSILSMALSEHVIEQDKVTTIEFGMGSEPYKQDWMDKKRERVTLQAFNERNFWGALLAARYLLPAKIKTLLSRKG